MKAEQHHPISPLARDTVAEDQVRGRFQSKGRIVVKYVPDPDIGFRVDATFMKHEVPFMLRGRCFQPGTILWNNGKGIFETVYDHRNVKGVLYRQKTIETTAHELAEAGIDG